MIAKLLAAGAFASSLLMCLGGCDQALKADERGGDVPSLDGANLTCSSRRDCTYDIVPAVETEADCGCPKCPVDAPAIARAAYDERAKQFAKVCGEWSKTNACPPTFCTPPSKLSCNAGQCGLDGRSGGTP